MNSRKITIIVLAVATACVIGWDIYAVINTANNDTVSFVLRDFAAKHGTIPFGLGVIMGHLFWHRKTPIFGMSKNTAFFVTVGGLLPLVLLIDIFWNPDQMAFILPMLGYLVGHLFWPQQPKVGAEQPKVGK